MKKFLKSTIILGLSLFPDRFLLAAGGNDMESRLKGLYDIGYRPKTILDVGAYIGQWTRMAHSIFPEARIIMFEAQDSKREFLEVVKNISPLIDYEIGLLGDQSGREVAFFEMETGSSIYSENSHHPRVVVHKSMKKLEELLTLRRIEKIDLIKLDVQGAELSVLDGLGVYLKTCRFVLLEASIANLNHGAPLLQEVMEYMKNHSFELKDICDFKRLRRDDTICQCDFLFEKISR